MMICELCGSNSKNYCGFKALSSHIRQFHHVNSKDYYDMYLIKSGEGICANPNCNNKTSFKKLSTGYHKFCSRKCGNEDPDRRKRISYTLKNNEEHIAKSTERIIAWNKSEEGKAASHKSTVYQKTSKTMHKSGNESSWEDYLENKLIKLKVLYEKHYKETRYPYFCDFYLPEFDTFIEIHGFWMHGGHFFDFKNEDDLKLLEKWKNRTPSMYQKAIQTWTYADLLKRDIAKQNNLNYVVLWTLEDIDDYVEDLKKLKGKDVQL